MAQQTINWLEAVIRRGLSKLYCLSLEKTPAVDMLDACVHAWIRALIARKHWQLHDEDRLDEGFNVLLSIAKQWPSPAQYLEAIPARAAMPTYPGHKAPALPAPTLQLVQEGSKAIPGSIAHAEITKLAELLHVDLTKSAEEETKDYRQAPERPWGVDLVDWENGHAHR